MYVYSSSLRESLGTVDRDRDRDMMLHYIMDKYYNKELDVCG